MSFGGSVLAMIQSLRANARPKHHAFQGWKKAEARQFHSNIKPKYKEISPEKLQQIIKSNKKKIDREQQRSLFIKLFVLIVLLLLAAFTVFQFFFNTSQINHHPYQPSLENEEILSDTEQINYLLNSGYEWLNKNHYKNARFQFNRVLESQPENKTAYYGLTASYVYECKIDRTGCEKARQLLGTYISKFGEDSSTSLLKDMLDN